MNQSVNPKQDPRAKQQMACSQNQSLQNGRTKRGQVSMSRQKVAKYLGNSVRLFLQYTSDLKQLQRLILLHHQHAIRTSFLQNKTPPLASKGEYSTIDDDCMRGLEEPYCRTHENATQSAPYTIRSSHRPSQSYIEQYIMCEYFDFW